MDLVARKTTAVSAANTWDQPRYQLGSVIVVVSAARRMIVADVASIWVQLKFLPINAIVAVSEVKKRTVLDAERQPTDLSSFMLLNTFY